MCLHSRPLSPDPVAMQRASSEARERREVRRTNTSGTCVVANTQTQSPRTQTVNPWPKSTVRIAFGVVSLIDAAPKWTPRLPQWLHRPPEGGQRGPRRLAGRVVQLLGRPAVAPPVVLGVPGRGGGDADRRRGSPRRHTRARPRTSTPVRASSTPWCSPPCSPSPTTGHVPTVDRLLLERRISWWHRVAEVAPLRGRPASTTTGECQRPSFGHVPAGTHSRHPVS